MPIIVAACMPAAVPERGFAPDRRDSVTRGRAVDSPPYEAVNGRLVVERGGCERLPTVAIGGVEVPVAVGARARLLGLAWLELEEAGAGLLIPRCSSVHTFGMRFALDLVFLDSRRRPLATRRAVPPRRLAGAARRGRRARAAGARSERELRRRRGRVESGVGWVGVDASREARDRTGRRLRGRRRDPRAALRSPRRRSLRRAARAQRLRRAAPLPLQPARPAAARPGAARRLGPRRPARDPREPTAPTPASTRRCR